MENSTFHWVKWPNRISACTGYRLRGRGVQYCLYSPNSGTLFDEGARLIYTLNEGFNENEKGQMTEKAPAGLDSIATTLLPCLCTNLALIDDFALLYPISLLSIKTHKKIRIIKIRNFCSNNWRWRFAEKIGFQLS